MLTWRLRCHRIVHSTFMQFDVTEILRQFDQEAESFTFPMLDNGYYYHGDQKLTIYRDTDRWAMSIETLAFNNHEQTIDGITTHAAVFGNCILTRELNNNDNFFFFAEDNGVPTFLEDDETYISYLNPDAKSIKVREQLVPISHGLQHYYSKGIYLEYSDKIVNYEFLRGLIPESSDLFWVTRHEIAKKIPTDLPVLMTLRNWYHPDLAASEKPSENETFQQLALVISTGDTSFYKPTKEPNTHWKNWPEGGAL